MSDKYFVFESKYLGNQGDYWLKVRCENLAPSGHEYLFRFLSYSLSHFRSLVEAYSYDLAMGNVKGEPIPDGKDGLYHAAKEIHPLFENRIAARGLILRSIIEYARHINRALEVLLALSAGPISSVFEQEKTSWSTESGTKQRPHRGSVYSLFNTQDRIRTAITALLDESTPTLSSMQKKDREAVYTALFSQGGGLDEMSLKIELMHSPSRKSEQLQAWADSLPGNYRISINRLLEFISGDYHSKWMPVLNSAQDEEASSVFLAYKVHTLEDILEMELYDMLRESTRIGRCKACGRFFVIDSENAEYCTIEENGKNCLRTYREGVTKDMYWKAYKTHNQRLSRGRCTEEEFRAWKAEASAAREDVLQRRITMAEYEMILKK